MPPLILPLPMILFQLLWLLIAVAIEAFFFHQKLRLPRKTSIEYSLSINLFSGLSGWLVFFYLQNKLAEDLRINMISYVVIGEFYGFRANFNQITLLISLGLILLISNSLLKILFFKGLRLLFEGWKEAEIIYTSSTKIPRLTRRSQNIQRQPSLPSIIFIANIFSYLIIFLILLIRSIPSLFPF